MNIKGEKHRMSVNNSDLSGSLLDDVNLSGCTYENVNMSGGKYHNINLAGCAFDDLNMSGWTVHNVNLSGMRVDKANLAGASIVNSRLQGMTIDGVEVTDLLAAWQERQASREASCHTSFSTNRRECSTNIPVTPTFSQVICTSLS